MKSRSSGLFVQIQQGRNYGTRRRSGGPHGGECSFLTHSRGVPKKKVIPMPATLNCLCVLSDHRQQECDGVTRQRQCARTRSCSGRLRPSRERSFTALPCQMLMLLTSVPPQNRRRACFVLRVVLPTKKNLPTHRRGLRKMLTTPRP